MRKSLLSSLIATGLCAAVSFPALAAPKTDFSVCWTIYAGWMPWEYGQAEGIVDKWAKKYSGQPNGGGGSRQCTCTWTTMSARWRRQALAASCWPSASCAVSTGSVASPSARGT